MSWRREHSVANFSIFTCHSCCVVCDPHGACDDEGRDASAGSRGPNSVSACVLRGWRRAPDRREPTIPRRSRPYRTGLCWVASHTTRRALPRLTLWARGWPWGQGRLSSERLSRMAGRSFRGWAAACRLSQFVTPCSGTGRCHITENPAGSGHTKEFVVDHCSS